MPCSVPSSLMIARNPRSSSANADPPQRPPHRVVRVVMDEVLPCRRGFLLQAEHGLGLVARAAVVLHRDLVFAGVLVGGLVHQQYPPRAWALTKCWCCRS